MLVFQLGKFTVVQSLLSYYIRTNLHCSFTAADWFWSGDVAVYYQFIFVDPDVRQREWLIS